MSVSIVRLFNQSCVGFSEIGLSAVCNNMTCETRVSWFQRFQTNPQAVPLAVANRLDDNQDKVCACTGDPLSDSC